MIPTFQLFHWLILYIDVISSFLLSKTQGTVHVNQIENQNILNENM